MEIGGTSKSAEMCGTMHTVVSEKWDTLYSLLMRSVGHHIHSALIPFLHTRPLAAVSLDAAIKKAATNSNNFN